MRPGIFHVKLWFQFEDGILSPGLKYNLCVIVIFSIKIAENSGLGMFRKLDNGKFFSCLWFFFGQACIVVFSLVKPVLVDDGHSCY